MNPPESDLMSAEATAAYLRVAERTVYDWAESGSLPGEKRDAVWRFARAVVDRWLAERFGLSAPSGRTQTKEVELSMLLSPRLIHFFSAPVSKQEVLEKLCSLMAFSPRVKNAEELKAGIFKREELMSTGLGPGLAVPHIRLDSVADVVVAAAVCAEPIPDYQTMDEEPVRLVFMIAGTPAQHETHIKLLAQLASRLKQKPVRERLFRATTTEEVLLLLADFKPVAG